MILAVFAHACSLKLRNTHIIFFAMGSQGSNPPSQPLFWDIERQSMRFVTAEDHPAGSYLKCTDRGCSGSSWIWSWRLRLGNENCRTCGAYWADMWVANGYFFWTENGEVSERRRT